MNDTPSCRLVFISGTDTGVGKTVLTALLLSFLRRRQLPALAIKPFCSGSRADARLLQSLQGGDLTLDEINPFFFQEPLAPLAAAGPRGGCPRLEEVLAHVRKIGRHLELLRDPMRKSKSSCSFLLIEGSGGLLVPLGPGYFVLDIIQELSCEAIIVSPNKLGTLNHTLLTLRALEASCRRLRSRAFPKQARAQGKGNLPAGSLRPKVVLMQQKRSDASSASNPALLADLMAPVPLWTLPFLPGNLRRPEVIREMEKKFEKTLARILD